VQAYDWDLRLRRTPNQGRRTLPRTEQPPSPRLGCPDGELRTRSSRPEPVRRVVDYAPVAFEEIEAAVSGPAPNGPAGPVSCAAVVAKKMGQSDRHAAMAAGFAGGIGLSGGACGALGAAIWIIEMTRGEAGESYDAVNARAGETIESFLIESDYEFECSAIVGRKFESAEDHACHLQTGGCSKLIDVLAGSLPARPR